VTASDDAEALEVVGAAGVGDVAGDELAVSRRPLNVELAHRPQDGWNRRALAALASLSDPDTEY
jgi:hypothetical protein